MSTIPKSPKIRRFGKGGINLLMVALFLGAMTGTVKGQTVQNPHGSLNLDCQLCHSTENWTKMRAEVKFNHAATNFPLEGRHTAVSCRACHSSLEFSKVSTSCFGCHQDVHANQFGDACARCHTPSTWTDESRFRQMHQETRFPLMGAHATEDCERCHAGGRYADTPLDCYGCHEQTYASTTDPDHHGAGFSVACEQCHSVAVTSWTGNLGAFQHTPNFPLTGGHNVSDCRACHQPGTVYSQTSTDCYSCHSANYQSAANPNHVSGGFPTTCATCHTTLGWSPAQFNHSQTSFPLTGAHATLACNLCHVNGQYSNTPTDCYSCHQTNFNQANNPIHTAPAFSYICTVCHNTTAWSPSTFNHNTQTSYTLTGAHLTASCASCHANGVYAGTSTLCYSCHQQNYQGALDPNHVANNYPTQCELCHSTTTWNDATFDHNQTPFPLTGAHATVSCQACHSQGYAGTPTDCYTCHQTNYNQANNPIHSPGISHTCTQCHTTAAWSPSTFSHTAQTPWPLTGAHITASCASCHPNGNYAGTSMLCYSCHQADYQGAQDPNHVVNNFPHECEQCHNTTSWGDGVFDHNQTPFPLTGAHVGLNCLACHSQGYAGTPTACNACHQTDYNQATNPIHTLPWFSYTCTDCHTTTAWSPSSFSHPAIWPLTGAHLTVACNLCHVTGQYSTTPTDCYGCHQNDYGQANNPIHAPELSHTCTDCHTTTAWSPSIFNHGTQTPWQLTGAHQTVACNLCHVNGQYSTTPTDCYGCHQNDYGQANNPIHAPELSHTCTDCHTTTAWSPSIFNHGTQTPWQLTGAHVTVACNHCHVNGQYANTPTDCYGCHQNNYNQASNPIHVLPWFSYTCTDCHTTTAWSPSSFTHPATWPLTGAHLTVACNLCHVNGQYSTTPTDCYGCHQNDYQGTTNPNHQAAGFPTNCELCHTTITWQGATFNHDALYFPIYSGSHQGTWNSCTDCHVGGIYTDFSCITCHEHNQIDMDQAHQEVPGYVYESHACYNCHPTGGGGGMNRHLKHPDKPVKGNK